MKLAAILIAAIIPFAADAQAGRNCAPREMVVKRLAAKFGETRKMMGLGSNYDVVEVFASEASGSWTITVTSASGTTCLVASGQAFEVLSETLPEGDPT